MQLFCLNFIFTVYYLMLINNLLLYEPIWFLFQIACIANYYSFFNALADIMPIIHYKCWAGLQDVVGYD